MMVFTLNYANIALPKFRIPPIPLFHDCSYFRRSVKSESVIACNLSALPLRSIIGARSKKDSIQNQAACHEPF